MRRRMGAAALDLDAGSDDSRQTQWRATVAARLPSQHWPQRTLHITAVDAHTGEPVVFDRDSGVDLVDAVAASCAGGGFPYTIGDRRHIDGGYRRSSENADLAAGYGRVLVLSPLAGRSLAPPEWVVVTGSSSGRTRRRIHQIAAGRHVVRRPALPDAGRALGERLTDFWRRRPRNQSTRVSQRRGCPQDRLDGPVDVVGGHHASVSPVEAG